MIDPDRALALSLAVLPYVVFGAFLVRSSRKSNFLDGPIEITPMLHKALLVHFWYFIGVPISIEVFPDLIPHSDYLIGTLVPSTSNGAHMISCLAAENFFVTATALGVILMQANNNNVGVKRWMFLAPLAQLTWNLKNHLSWFLIPLAPEGRMPFAVLDMLLIWPITVIYLQHYFLKNEAGGVTSTTKKE